MIRTAKLRRFSFGLSHYRCRVMTANVEESAQHAVVSAHDHDRLACDVGRDILARLTHLIRARRELPRLREDGFELELVEVFVRCTRTKGLSMQDRAAGLDRIDRRSPSIERSYDGRGSFPFGIEERCFHDCCAHVMANGFNSDLELQSRARPCVLAIHGRERNHSLQCRRPRGGCSFANLHAFLEHRHRDARSDR